MKQSPEITGYRFGSLKVGGKPVTTDLIIYPDGRVQTGWRRRSGHLLEYDDIQSISAGAPDLLIVGTGANGRMDVDMGIKDKLRGANPNADLICLKTADAVERYNLEIQTSKKVAACFHLTC